MQDTALYQYLVGLKSPWTVSRVDLNGKGRCAWRCGLSTWKARRGPVLTARGDCRSATTPRSIDNILPCAQHPVTNAMSEVLNSKMQRIKSMACGFRNLENFKTAIYFHCGGLDLYPC
jgi:hypothetical protein